MNRPVDVPGLVAAGLPRCAVAERQAFEMPRRNNEEWAARADRLGELRARRARWWSVLARWAYRSPTVPPVLAMAAVAAESADLDHARSWREMAGDWRRLTAEDECCQVIGGCGCLGHDRIGVA
jgi:hypothetical protein